MKTNLKFLLALENSKLIMVNNSGEDVFYARNLQKAFKKDLSKIALLLHNR